MPKAERDLNRVLDEAYLHGFTVQSDFARRNAEMVALAASLRLITTQIAKQKFSRTWRVTSKGLRTLAEAKDTK